MSLGQWHKCPKCGRKHRALTKICYLCKRLDTQFELEFEHPQIKEDFEEKMARIQHEEKMLRAKGHKPTQISAGRADRILQKVKS